MAPLVGRIDHTSSLVTGRSPCQPAPMARFLSPEWLEELSGAARRSEQLHQAAGGKRLTVQQVVKRRGGETICYYLRLVNGEVTVAPGLAPDPPDIEVTQHLDTAVAISRGDLTPAAAFGQGLVKVRGDLRTVLAHQEAFAGLDDAFARLRAETTY